MYEQLHSYQDRGIWVDRDRSRLYIYVSGPMDRNEFLMGQAIIETAIDQLYAKKPKHVDLIHDTTDSRPVTPTVLPLFLERSRILLNRFPSLDVWIVTTAKSYLGWQLLTFIPPFQKRIRGIFSSFEAAERVVDNVRGHEKPTDSQEVEIKAIRKALKRMAI
jgi:hypothetical protein